MIRFRVRPSIKHKFYYSVFIFDNKDQMLIYYKEHCKIVKHKYSPLEAGCLFYRKPLGKFKNKLGDIIFYSSYMGAGVVSHEMTHAAIFCSDIFNVKMGKIFGRVHGEKFCDLVGQMNMQFWRHFFKADGGK